MDGDMRNRNVERETFLDDQRPALKPAAKKALAGAAAFGAFAALMNYSGEPHFFSYMSESMNYGTAIVSAVLSYPLFRRAFANY